MADGAQYDVVAKILTGMGAATLPSLAIIGRKIYTRLGLIPAIGHQVAQLTKRMADLETKFKPNGGSSLDDVIRGIKTETEQTRHKLSAVMSTLDIHDQKHYVIWATQTDGIYEADTATGDYLWVNPALSEMFGLDANNMLERNWLRAVLPQEREGVWLRWMESLKNGIPFEAEYTIQNIRTREKFRVSTAIIKSLVRENKPITHVGIVKRIKTDG